MIKDKSLVIGIDEAGRGPVIGNMFIVCLGVSRNYLSKLIKIGVRDSKKLTPKKRSELAPKISQLAKIMIVESVAPKYIDRHNINIIFAMPIHFLWVSTKPHCYLKWDNNVGAYGY